MLEIYILYLCVLVYISPAAVLLAAKVSVFKGEVTGKKYVKISSKKVTFPLKRMDFKNIE